MNKTTQIIAAGALAFAVASSAAPSADAFGFDKIPGLGGGGSSSSSSVNVDGLVNQNTALVKRFVSSLSNLNKAQVIIMDAFKIKASRDLTAEEREHLQSGDVDGKDELNRIVASTAANQVEINKKIAAGAKLDAQGKVKLAEAMLPYTKGTVDGILLAPEMAKWASSVQSGISSLKSNPTGLMKLKNGVSSGLWVATKIPGLVSKWYDDTQKLQSYGEKSKIDMSKSKSILANVKAPA